MAVVQLLLQNNADISICDEVYTYDNYVQIMPSSATDYAWLFPRLPISKDSHLCQLMCISTSLTQSSHQVLNPVAICENFLSCYCGLDCSSLHGISKVPSAHAILPSRPHPCPVFLYTYNDALIAA